MKIYNLGKFLFRFTLTLPIRIYQVFISPLLGQKCKYHPSCSSYAVGAIMNNGLFGIFLAGWRLLRCNPWSNGGVDYPPKTTKFSNFLDKRNSISEANVFTNNEKEKVGA
jgi:uncharacterized protein